MGRLLSILFPVSFLSLALVLGNAQNLAPNSQPPTTPVPAATATTLQGQAPPIPANAPHMSKQTRYEIIRDFEMQLVYSRTAFPMGSKGIVLRNGTTAPAGQALQQLLALWGPSIKPGDPAHISYAGFCLKQIHFDLNGGPIHRKKWYQHVQISGANGTPVPLSKDQEVNNPHGSYLDVYFDKYVPEMSAAQLRELLFPVLDFNARNKEEAYLDTVPPKVKEAIQTHHVLVGMNSEMVIHAVGKPPKKVRERDADTEYEEWIYGEPPHDVDFVRLVGDEVVRIETMKIGGQKVLRTEKEVILKKPDQEEEAKREQERPRPASAPRPGRGGEDAESPPKPADGIAPPPPHINVPQPQGSPGPGDNVGHR